MARVRWHGVEFEAQPLRPVGDGTRDWWMMAGSHAPRIDHGSIIRVRIDEIVDPDATLLRQAAEEDMSVNSLAAKLQAAAGAATQITSDLEKRADDLIAKQAQIEEKGKEVFARHQAVLDAAARGLENMEQALAALGNNLSGSE